MSSSAGSNVGHSSLYEAADQRTTSQAEQNTRERYKEGIDNSHLKNDSKDTRSLANRSQHEKQEDSKEDQKSEETEQHNKDPTLPARAHGNEPSRGAQIDKELQDEEEEILKKKGSFGPK